MPYAIIRQTSIAIPPIVAYPSSCIGLCSLRAGCAIDFEHRAVYTLCLEIELCKSRDWFLPEANKRVRIVIYPETMYNYARHNCLTHKEQERIYITDIKTPNQSAIPYLLEISIGYCSLPTMLPSEDDIANFNAFAPDAGEGKAFMFLEVRHSDAFGRLEYRSY